MRLSSSSWSLRKAIPYNCRRHECISTDFPKKPDEMKRIGSKEPGAGLSKKSCKIKFTDHLVQNDWFFILIHQFHTHDTGVTLPPTFSRNSPLISHRRIAAVLGVHLLPWATVSNCMWLFSLQEARTLEISTVVVYYCQPQDFPTDYFVRYIFYLESLAVKERWQNVSSLGIILHIDYWMVKVALPYVSSPSLKTHSNNLIITICGIILSKSNKNNDN